MASRSLFLEVQPAFKLLASCVVTSAELCNPKIEDEWSPEYKHTFSGVITPVKHLYSPDNTGLNDNRKTPTVQSLIGR